ncbi:hypothetical protein GGR52DRAFT_524156 [Hypoxylon sp. FL1284]|nr:hypothetical protein GGR52DRAFT_524156 [Hypoxylon sp. FL1284]
MKLPSILSPGLAALAALASVARAAERTAAVHVQPIAADAPAPTLLAEIRYDIAAAADAEVVAYEAPELADEGSGLVRVGVYDGAAGRWTSSVSVASTANFGKGYAPALVLSVTGGDDDAVVLGAALTGVAIDAGQTRDFGPRALVRVAEPGRQPELNKPVVLSPQGAQQGAPEEKTFLQKYWWLIGIFVLLTMTGGGGGEQGK